MTEFHGFSSIKDKAYWLAVQEDKMADWKEKAISYYCLNNWGTAYPSTIGNLRQYVCIRSHPSFQLRQLTLLLTDFGLDPGVIGIDFQVEDMAYIYDSIHKFQELLEQGDKND